VQEVAAGIQRNWRTADRYVTAIAEETGLISMRTFREGSRGALKVVYWNALDRAKGSAHQESLLQRIVHGRRKEDFSPFDIYQFVDPKKREAFFETQEFSTHPAIRFDKLFSEAKHQVLFFSGNLSWVELGPNMQKVLLDLARRKVKIKALTRVDVTSRKNTEAMLNFNRRAGWDAVEVRHCEHPLRAIIVDDDFVCLKEVLHPQHYRETELKQKMFVFYHLCDSEWIQWLQKVFWHLWGQSIDANARLQTLDSVQVLRL